MQPVRRAAKKDANHNDVADYLEALGWSVLDLSQLGKGKPDMLVARHGFSALIEVKDGGKVPSKQKLSKDQETFAKGWKGVCIKALSPEDAEKQLRLAALYQSGDGL